MAFWNEGLHFEKHGERYVYRPTVLSAGFTMSESEKDRLFAALRRLQWHSLVEGLLAIALIAAVFMSGIVPTRQPIPWFVITSVLVVAVLAATILYRRDRLLVRILGRRMPDAPRLPLRQALAARQPTIAPRYAIMVLRSVVWLVGLATAAGDAFAVYLIVTAYRARAIAQGPEEVQAAEKFFALIVDNVNFWLAMAMFNAVMAAFVVALKILSRSLRTRPGPS